MGTRGEVAERVQLDDRRQGSVVIGVVVVDPPPEFVERSDEVSGALRRKALLVEVAKAAIGGAAAIGSLNRCEIFTFSRESCESEDLVLMPR